MYQYDIKYENEIMDIVTESFTKLSEARKRIKGINQSPDCLLIRTWRYLDGKYLGDIPPRIR